MRMEKKNNQICNAYGIPSYVLRWLDAREY